MRERKWERPQKTSLKQWRQRGAVFTTHLKLDLLGQQHCWRLPRPS